MNSQQWRILNRKNVIETGNNIQNRTGSDKSPEGVSIEEGK